MMNYKKLKNGFSMAELLVALSIFALISTIGFTALGFMFKTQYSRQLELEKQFIQEFSIYSQKSEDFSLNCCIKSDYVPPPPLNLIDRISVSGTRRK